MSPNGVARESESDQHRLVLTRMDLCRILDSPWLR